jgi:hypothetical protein
VTGDVRLMLFVQPPSGLYIPGREEPQTGRQTQQLLEEVASLSPKLHLEVHNPRLEPEFAERHAVARTPALILTAFPAPAGEDGTAGDEADAAAPQPESTAGASDATPEVNGGSGASDASPDAPAESAGFPSGRVRFFGMPSGYEFASLVEDIVDVSQRRTRLSDTTREALAALAGPLHFQVFVTPT